MKAIQRRHDMDKRANLLISNIPADCSEHYIKQRIEARGYRLFSVRLVRDLVTGTSPSFAHAQLMDSAKLNEAIRPARPMDQIGELTGERFRNLKVRV